MSVTRPNLPRGASRKTKPSPAALLDFICFPGVTGGFGEAASGQVHFAEISTPILEKVIQFVYYKVSGRQCRTFGGASSCVQARGKVGEPPALRNIRT